MNFGNAQFDLAEQRAEEERESSIAAASRSLRHTGASHCEDCAGEIPAQRRAALPSAIRCIRCQQHHEKSAGKRQ